MHVTSSMREPTGSERTPRRPAAQQALERYDTPYPRKGSSQRSFPSIILDVKVPLAVKKESSVWSEEGGELINPPETGDSSI